MSNEELTESPVINELAAIPDDFFTDGMRANMVFASVLLVKEYLYKQAPELLNERNLHIVIGGANQMDVLGDGSIYHALPFLVPELKDKSVTIHLVGPDVHQALSPVSLPVNAAYLNNGVQVKLVPETVADYLIDCVPHLICLNHPGFEVHIEQWWDKGRLAELFELDGTKVVGCSFGTDEVSLDALFMKAFNINVVNRQISERCVVEGWEAAAWGKTTWQLKTDVIIPDEAMLSLSMMTSERYMAMAAHFGDDFMRECMIELPTGEQLFWVESDFYWCSSRRAVVSLKVNKLAETGYEQMVVQDNVDLSDIERLKRHLKLSTEVFAALVSASVIEREGLSVDPVIPDNPYRAKPGDAENASRGGKKIGERLGGIKGLNQNPALLDMPLAERLRALGIQYRDEVAIQEPEIAFLGLMSEGLNVYRDHFGGGLSPEIIQSLAVMTAMNPHIDQSYLDKYGLTTNAADELTVAMLNLLNVGLDASELFYYSQRCLQRDLLESDNGEKEAAICRDFGRNMVPYSARFIAQQMGESGLSTIGKVTSCLQGLESWALENGVSIAELRYMLVTEAKSLERTFGEQESEQTPASPVH